MYRFEQKNVFRAIVEAYAYLTIFLKSLNPIILSVTLKIKQKNYIL